MNLDVGKRILFLGMEMKIIKSLAIEFEHREISYFPLFRLVLTENISRVNFKTTLMGSKIILRGHQRVYVALSAIIDGPYL